jgi:UV damage endonuclease UvdE
MIPKNFNFGYACLNTELRNQNPPVFTSRTLRLSTLKQKGFVYLKSLIDQNLKDLLTQLRWNIEHDIYFMRLTSEMFPFASHSEYGYSINFANEHLKIIGDFIKKNGIRLTMHPGQYNVLSSPKENVIRNTFLDLNHHCDILDRMGLGKDSVMIIHGGGIYGDKEKALERLEKNILLLPKNTRDRIVLENCEMSYNIQDLLPISEKLQVPIVLDFHHDSIYPSDNPTQFYFERVFAVWFNRCIKPKVHVSNSVQGITEEDNKTARRKHSDYIQFLHESLLKITFPLDVMLECKMKEQAIFRLLFNNKTLTI